MDMTVYSVVAKFVDSLFLFFYLTITISPTLILLDFVALR